MDVEVFDLNSGAKVAQWTSTQTFSPGQVRTLTNNWQTKSGRYQVRLGLFDPNWKMLVWLQDGPIFQVN